MTRFALALIVALLASPAANAATPEAQERGGGILVGAGTLVLGGGLGLIARHSVDVDHAIRFDGASPSPMLSIGGALAISGGAVMVSAGIASMLVARSRSERAVSVLPYGGPDGAGVSVVGVF